MTDAAASTPRAASGPARARPVGPPASTPCTTCPYRRDVPSGVWAGDEYDKLLGYDRPTFAQPINLWLCHQHDRDAPRRRICAGWAGCHDGPSLLALRVAQASGLLSFEDAQRAIAYTSPVPLFASAAHAVAHGLADLDRPSPAAVTAIADLTRRNSPSPQETMTDDAPPASARPGSTSRASAARQREGRGARPAEHTAGAGDSPR